MLGLLQGPAELLPISSSGHLGLVPWLLRWEWKDVDDELRKVFEVAVHGGAAAALAIVGREQLVPRTPRTMALLALSVAPAALLGLVFERPVERRLGNPVAVAGGLLGGGVALGLSDRCPQIRRHDEAGVRDALWLGLAQACALFPGVSRGGATLAAARLRGFRRADAQRLSRELGLPVIAGATVLKGVRLRGRRLSQAAQTPLLVGALASLGSTLASRPLLRPAAADRPLWPYAAYRVALATAVLARVVAALRRGSTAPRRRRART